MGPEVAQAIVSAVKVGNAVKGIARNITRTGKNLKKWSTPKQSKKSRFKKASSVSAKVQSSPSVPQPTKI